MNVAHAPTDPQHTLYRARLTLVAAVVVFLAAVALVASDAFHRTSGSVGITGSGVGATQARSVAPFTSVDLAGSNDVAIRVGTKRSVVVHADSNLLRVVTTVVRSDTLVIVNTAGRVATESPMNVEVSVPSLEAVTLSGSGNIAVTGIHTHAVAVNLLGSGNLSANGTTTRLDVTIEGSGNAALRRLVARDARAVV